ncbi:MAG: hypothetical protein AAGK47_02595 [Bacteroidota bacterium]
MMRILSYFTLLLALLCNSCSTGDELEFAFEMVYPNNVFEIEAGLNTIESHFFRLDDISSNLGLYFDGIDTSEIKSIVPREARLVVLDGSNIDFDFIFEISVRICRIDGTSCNREIFYRDEIQENVGRILPLIPNANSVKDELLQGEYGIEVVLQRLAYPPQQFVRVGLDLSFAASR